MSDDGRIFVTLGLLGLVGARAAIGSRGIVRAGRGERELEPYMEVEARVKTDDGAYEAIFNAIPYLRQASWKDLQKLAACNFGGDYPADEVAWWVASEGGDDEVAHVMRRIQKDSLGFEVHINEDEARAWLDAVRPGWAS